MKYSFIFCYRDRENHLRATIPAIQKLMAAYDTSYEIVVAEQIDTKPFRRANLLNEGAKYAAKDSDILILHDADHYPTANVIYYDGISDVFLPIQRVEFVILNADGTLTERPEADIPSGYRHFRSGVDSNYYGGVLSIVKEKFFAINGFSSLFRNWGFEEADLRNRIIHHKLTVDRGDGLFYALDHADSCPPPNNPDFQHNMMLASNSEKYFSFGINTQPSTANIVSSKIEGVTTWIECTDFDPPVPGSEKIVASTFNFEDIE
jgi:hypothetical protein